MMMMIIGEMAGGGVDCRADVWNCVTGGRRSNPAAGSLAAP